MGSRATRGSGDARRRVVLVAAAAVLLAVGAYAGFRLVRIAAAASAGKDALLAAEGRVSARDLDGALVALDEATREFATVEAEMDALGPIAAIGRAVPLVRAQVRGIDAFGGAGRELARAGKDVVFAAQRILEPEDEDANLRTALTSLGDVGVALDRAERAQLAAAARIDSLEGRRLLGPLGDARAELVARLPSVLARTRDASGGLRAFLAFAGRDAPRRHLLLSQNPDELRPTGGFIGTYGVLHAGGGTLELERYGSIESWTAAHPDAVVAPHETATPFRLFELQKVQNLSNVNAVADWPTAAWLATRLWTQAGESPVDAVIGFTPEVLARYLAVIGPTRVDEYGETITAENALERIDFYTHGEAADAVPDAERKNFVAAAASAVLSRLLDAPASSWVELADATSKALNAREAMVWSSDPDVAREVARRGWAGRLPEVDGDFFFAGEFEFAAKNGRGLRRTYDHEVTLRADGSGTVRTTVTISNPQPRQPFVNDDTLFYITAYGPQGGRLGTASDAITAEEQTVYGHPAVGFDRIVRPEGAVSFTVEWDVPSLARRHGDASWSYDLTWLPVIGNRGDELRLTVDLPDGARWSADSPPATLPLREPFTGSWRYEGPVVRSD